TVTCRARVAARRDRSGRPSRSMRLRPCTLLLGLPPAGRAIYRILRFSQIADRVVSPSLQRAEHMSDIPSLHTGIVHAADAGVHHVGIAAEPNRSGPQNGDALVRAIREFDGPRLSVRLQITPIGSSPRYLVHVLEVFLVIAHVTVHVAPAGRRTVRRDLVR